MVGIAAMQLRLQGKLDLDAPATTYLPYFHLADERYRQILMRQILSHRSGLPWCSNYQQCDLLDYQSPEYDVWTPEIDTNMPSVWEKSWGWDGLSTANPGTGW